VNDRARLVFLFEITGAAVARSRSIANDDSGRWFGPVFRELHSVADDTMSKEVKAPR